MKVGIAGLGLIGGSFAKVYAAAGWQVLGFEKDEHVFGFASLSGAVSGRLDEKSASDCDLILVCLYRAAAEEFLNNFGPFFGKKPIVIDCCGTKKRVCETGFAAAEKFGFRYIGGHPMAGTQYSGFKYSRANLFSGAPMVLCPPDFEDIALLAEARKLLAPAGFGSFTVSDPETHDRVIAFTSQLAHVVSSAYIKSASSALRKGYSAGSYKDMTRVAYMNPEMWTELFLDDRENLINEIDSLTEHLAEYRDALDASDREELIRLIADGKAKKEEADKR